MKEEDENIKTPNEYKNLFTAQLIKDYPLILDFNVDVKLFDRKTDEDYLLRTSIAGRVWFVEWDNNTALSIMSNHPHIQEACMYAIHIIRSKKLTMQDYCDMDYIKVEFVCEPPVALLELMSITMDQFNKLYCEAPNGWYRNVIKQETIK